MLELYEQEQPIPTAIIKTAVLNNRIAHAYVIQTNGYEKGYDFALSFAKLLLCINYTKCDKNKCTICKMIDDGNYPELKVINPDGNIIKKEQLIELQEEFSKKSIYGSRKVYIINNADKLNQNSSNTILKFLEEPEEGIIAILVVDNVYKLLETIISRCQIISLNGKVKKGIDIKEKIALLTSLSFDEYNAFMESETSSEDINNVVNFVNHIEKNKLKSLVDTNKYFFDHFSDKQSVKWAIIIMIYFYKDILNYKIGKKIEIFAPYIDIIESIDCKKEKLLNKINKLNEARINLDYNANLNLIIDRIIIQLEGEV